MGGLLWKIGVPFLVLFISNRVVFLRDFSLCQELFETKGKDLEDSGNEVPIFRIVSNIVHPHWQFADFFTRPTRPEESPSTLAPFAQRPRQKKETVMSHKSGPTLRGAVGADEEVRRRQGRVRCYIEYFWEAHFAAEWA